MVNISVLTHWCYSFKFKPVIGHPILKFCQGQTSAAVIAYQVKLNPLSEILATGLHCDFQELQRVCIAMYQQLTIACHISPQ